MRSTFSALVLTVFLTPTLVADPSVDPAAYGRCTDAVMKGSTAGNEALSLCEQPAKQGVPGAQYAMGALLVNRNGPGDMAAGIEWLEKAVASGSPPAAFHLASVLLSRSDETSVSRGRELFRSAVCSGYPQALAALKKQGVSAKDIPCSPSPDADFSGEWLMDLTFHHTAPSGTSKSTLKITIDGRTVHVFMKRDDDWFEVKPGKFVISQVDESITVSATDSGWDFDGKWVETWHLALLRTASDEASVAYLRTVNNPYVPPSFSWRTFTTFGEGKAKKLHK